MASNIDIILKYFPKLTENQQSQFEQLGDLYREWNQKINVISRKDIENLYPHHILHSLAIAKKINFKSGSKVLDLGTGGGMPGIPLAILFPHVQFTLVDGTRKKILVVQEIADAIGLKNVNAIHTRAEELKEKFDFVICRAVASMDKLYGWSLKLIGSQHKHGLPNGLITLKGGNVKEEIKLLPGGSYTEVWPVTDVFPEDFFEEKVMVYVQI